jgi:acyl-coenzyme A synthetase/AMP-(fatty) acid ligase
VIRALVPHRPGDPVAFGEGGARCAADLLADASRIARALEGFSAGELTLACADRYHAAAALLGSWMAGRPVALPPNGQDEAVRAAVRASPSGVLLHDRAGAEDGVDLRSLLAGPAGSTVLPEIPEGRHVVTLWTSGSTGAPQRFPKTAGQILGEALLLPRLFAIGPCARVVATVPAHHIYGLLFGVLAPLAGGGAFGRTSPLHAEAVAAALRDAGATHLVSSPAHLHGLLVLDGLPRLDRAFSSGGALAGDVRERLAARLGLSVVEIYGSTETGGVAHRDEADGPWMPFPGVEVSIGDDGRLLVDSPFLPPAAPRPFAPGDLAEAVGGGAFRLLGRADGVIKVAGKRVALAEVEARLLALPGVRDAAVLAVPSSGIREVELRAAVVAPGQDEGAIRSGLLAWLDPVTLPRRIRLVDALPREGTGKLPRDRLLAILAPEGDVLEFERMLGPSAAPWFEGHFDGFPVLPGVVQLVELVLRPARCRWPDLGEPLRIRRLKFQRLIRPGETVTVRISRPAGQGRLEFRIACGDEPCSSGRFDLGAAP